jgi:hypothetical protein
LEPAARAAAVSAGLLAASLASADYSKIVYQVTAKASDGSTGSMFVDFNQLNPNPLGATWALPEPVTLKSASGKTLGTVQYAWLELIADPEVNLGFLVQAGPVTTEFTITSALLSFPGINPASGKATVQVGVTDLNGDGATLTGLIPSAGGDRVYRAAYNGSVPGGSEFTSLVSGVSAGPGSSNGTSIDDPAVGLKPIAGTVNDMSSMIKFSLTAFDTASGTTNYQIVPEPASIFVLGLGALALFRRR